MNMKTIMIFFYILLASFLCHASSLNNKGSWHTLETDLFKIHFTEESQFIINDVLLYATEAHTKLSKFFLFDPVKDLKQKTHLVLISSSDETNGAATPLPQNTIYLYLNLPIEGSMLENYSSFLRALIIHEYTHIVNISSKRDYSKLLYTIFGNIMSPNLLHI